MWAAGHGPAGLPATSPLNFRQTPIAPSWRAYAGGQRPALLHTTSRRRGLIPTLNPISMSRSNSSSSSLTTARAAASSKDVAPAIVTYVIQKGETLWDVAIQHGVSMRTIKDLNKLPGKDPVLVEGQKLLVPASGITALPAADGAVSAAALGSNPARGLWVGSEHVRLAPVSEARQLYLRQCERGNTQNTLLVLYAPWCPHCRDMEDEVERLAEGLSGVSAVRVVAVNGDSAEGRLFAREVLGVAYYPSIIAFPHHSRTFFKYKGRQRDAESLLRFLNMTCCAREDAFWALRPVGATAAMAGPGGKGGPLLWAKQWLPVGTSPTAMATAAALLAAAALAAAVSYSAVVRRRRAAAADGLEADVVAELDSSLGRMVTLMMRVVRTRLGLLLGLAPAAAPTSEAQAAEAPAVTGTTASEASGTESASAAAPSESSNGHQVQEASQPAVAVVAAAANISSEEGSGGAAAAADGAVAVAASGTSDAAPAASPSGLHRELTAEERLRLTRLTDDELIALVNSEPDLDKVLSRLLGDK